MTSETFPYPGPSDAISHPGSLLAEELEMRGMSQRALARRIGRPFQVVNEIVRGRKSITPETALQLEAEFGTPAYIWLGLQSKYDLAQARLRMKQAKLAS